MNSESHDMCRHELVEGELSATSKQHLDECPECARFAVDLDRALEDIRSTGVSMPPGLASRVMRGVRTERPPTEEGTVVATFRPAPRPSARRRLRTASKVAAAAAALIVIAIVLVPILGRTDAKAALLQAARRTADQKTARLALETNTRGRPLASSSPAPGSTPQFSIDTQLRGTVAFGNALQIEGSTSLRGHISGIDLDEPEFDLLVVPGQSFDLRSDGPGTRAKAPPVGQTLAGPDSLVDMLTAGARGDITEVGEEHLAGISVRHYRFRLPASAFLPPFPGASVSGWTGQAWIGVEDQTLRGFSAVAQGDADALGLNWQTMLHGSVSGFGSDFKTPRGSVTSDGRIVLPLSQAQDLSPYQGQSVSAQSVRVQSVVGDEQFWVGASEDNRIFVHIATSGESPPHLSKGDSVSFVGTMRDVPADVASMFGLAPAEGLSLLRTEKAYAEVSPRQLRVE